MSKNSIPETVYTPFENRRIISVREVVLAT